MPTSEDTSLTASDIESIADDAAGTHLLTAQEVEKIATFLNKHLNIPGFGKKREQRIFYKLVKRIDGYLYEALPNEVYSAIRSVEDGITDEEARRMQTVFAKEIDKRIPIRFVPSWLEAKIFSLAVGLIVDSIRRDWDLETVLTAANA